MKQKSKKKQREKKRRKSKISLLLKLIIVLALGAGLYFFASSSFFNVTAFQVSGNSYYTQDEILVMGDCKTGGNIFWGSGLGDIKERLEKDPYMEQVKVKRVLPDKIAIELKERTQLGAVIYSDSYLVVSGDSMILRKTEIEPQLTLIQGFTISKLEVGQTIEVEEGVLLRQIMEMLETMASTDMYFKRIVVDESGIKAYVLDNLVCVGTPDHITEAMEDGNLQKVVKGLFDINIERGTINISGSDYISFNPAIS